MPGIFVRLSKVITSLALCLIELRHKYLFSSMEVFTKGCSLMRTPLRNADHKCGASCSCMHGILEDLGTRDVQVDDCFIEGKCGKVYKYSSRYVFNGNYHPKTL